MRLLISCKIAYDFVKKRLQIWKMLVKSLVKGSLNYLLQKKVQIMCALLCKNISAIFLKKSYFMYLLYPDLTTFMYRVQTVILRIWNENFQVLWEYFVYLKADQSDASQCSVTQ